MTLFEKIQDPASCHRPSLNEDNALTRLGQGDWAAFNLSVPVFEDAARDWSRTLQGIDRPWLCWNMSPAWCLIQQKLVNHVGWTPVVGFDPKYALPPLVDGAVLIDFNARLNLPQMWMHFPLDAVRLFAPRLAFWHSDLLCRFSMMEDTASLFEKLPDGEMAAVYDHGGMRRLLNLKMHRYYELLGCMTRGASQSNFDKGCGWWRNIHHHPNAGGLRERTERANLFYDHGFGIMHWKKKYGGKVRNLSMRRAKEGHCSEIGNKSYQNLPGHWEAERNSGGEMELNYDIEQVCRRLGIQSLL